MPDSFLPGHISGERVSTSCRRATMILVLFVKSARGSIRLCPATLPAQWLTGFFDVRCISILHRTSKLYRVHDRTRQGFSGPYVVCAGGRGYLSCFGMSGIPCPETGAVVFVRRSEGASGDKPGFPASENARGGQQCRSTMACETDENCPNRLLLSQIASVRRSAHRYELAYMRTQKTFNSSIAQHNRIIRAIARQDTDEACRWLEENCLMTVPTLLKWLASPER